MFRWGMSWSLDQDRCGLAEFGVERGRRKACGRFLVVSGRCEIEKKLEMWLQCYLKMTYLCKDRRLISKFHVELVISGLT